MNYIRLFCIRYFPLFNNVSALKASTLASNSAIKALKNSKFDQARSWYGVSRHFLKIEGILSHRQLCNEYTCSYLSGNYSIATKILELMRTVPNLTSAYFYYRTWLYATCDNRSIVKKFKYCDYIIWNDFLGNTSCEPCVDYPYVRYQAEVRIAMYLRLNLPLKAQYELDKIRRSYPQYGSFAIEREIIQFTETKSPITITETHRAMIGERWLTNF